MEEFEAVAVGSKFVIEDAAAADPVAVPPELDAPAAAASATVPIVAPTGSGGTFVLSTT